MFYSIVLFLLPSIVIHFLTPFTVKMELRMPNNRIGVEMKEKCENEENGLAMGEERLDFHSCFHELYDCF